MAIRVVALPTGYRAYIFVDENYGRVLVAAARVDQQDRQGALRADTAFLEKLFETGGHAFGIEMAGGPPDGVRMSRRWPVETWMEWVTRLLGYNCGYDIQAWDWVAELVDHDRKKRGLAPRWTLQDEYDEDGNPVPDPLDREGAFDDLLREWFETWHCGWIEEARD